jgi:cytochrome c peroxidase
MKNFSYAFMAVLVLASFFSGTIDLDNLFNYANQDIPSYITRDNTGNNPIDDKIATLGRVLFYDKTLSRNNTVSCSSCHQQALGFSDAQIQSSGVDGVTGRHSMRLINSRFSEEVHFFWDERAATLEEQTTQPIQDHIEMGFSGTNGDPNINDLIDVLSGLDYYQQLFPFAFGDGEITEERMQLALAQFVRSIQSFDSRFDQGMAQVNNDFTVPFPNFSTHENHGKDFFMDPPPNGAGCAGCHRPPEFDIDPLSLNNGVIPTADGSGIDLTNTRSPSLRDVVRANGAPNGPLMHNGAFNTLLDVVAHYNQVPNNPENTNLDPRLLGPNGLPQNLNLSTGQQDAIASFLRTLAGFNVYTDEKWSDPFDPDGTIEIIGGNLGIYDAKKPEIEIKLSPNPVKDWTQVRLDSGQYTLILINNLGQELYRCSINNEADLNLSHLSQGIYYLWIQDQNSQRKTSVKLIKS